MTQPNFIAVPAYGNLIEDAIRVLLPHGRDYSRNLVIFPNRRLAHFLRKELAREVGTALIPPDIFSIDEFIDYVYQSEQIDIKIEPIDAVAILYDLHKKSKNRIGRDGFISPESFFPLGLKIFNDIEELYIEKIPVSKVKDIDNLVGCIPVETHERLQRLSYFYEEFYKFIQKSGYSTRSERYRAAASKLDSFNLTHFSKIILAGFFALTESEKELFGKILSHDNSLIIFKDGSGIEEKVAEIGIEIKSPLPPQTYEPDIRFYSSPDVHGQVFGLSQLIKQELDKGSRTDEKILIAVPSSNTLFPLIQNCLSLLSPNDYNISIGYPLYRTPIFGFLNNLMELIASISDDKIYLPDYLKFVLHPYTKNILLDSEPECTRIIFHTIEKELSRKKTLKFLSLQEIESDDRILDEIFKRLEEQKSGISKDKISNYLKEIHQNTIGRFSSFKNIGDFAAKCLRLLEYIYNRSTARLHPLFYPFSEAFIAALNKISTSLMKDVSFPTISGYFMFFRKYIMTCSVPFEGAPLRGMQILGFLETRNLSFETIYILDANEDVLPSTNKESSLIPFAVRQGLKLPTYLDTDKISEYYFETLLKSAKQAHIFFVENDETEKSRFIEKLLWQRQKKDRTPDSKGFIWQIQYKVDLKSPAPKEISKTEKIIAVLKDFVFSPSALGSYLNCGLQFYYNYVLKIHKKEDLIGDIEKTDIGKLIHTALCRYFGKIKGIPLNEKKLSLTDMDSVLDNLFDKQFGIAPAGSAYLLKKQIKRRLRDLLKDYYIPLAREIPLKVLNCEYRIENIRVDSYMFKGRLDSIEQRGEKTVIIDYKISSSSNYYKINFSKLDLQNRASWQESVGSLQLPFYMLMYSEDNKIDADSLDAMFLLLGRNLINEKIELPFCDRGLDGKKCYETMRALIIGILNEISDPGAPFSPAGNLKKSCPFCDYRYLCGTEWAMK